MKTEENFISLSEIPVFFLHDLVFMKYKLEGLNVILVSMTRQI